MSIGVEGRTRILSLLPQALRRSIMIRRYRREIVETGEAELPYLRQMLHHGDLALDVGCNMGVYAYELGRITGNVIAFEPNPLLARLVGGLGLPGVEVRQVAASDRVHQTELLIPRGRFGHALATIKPRAHADMAVSRVAVKTQRLDSVTDDVKFVKIDVEGFEEQALSGAEELFRRGQSLFLIEIEERHNPGGLVRIVAVMKGHGYDAFFLFDGNWRPIAMFDPPRHQNVADDEEAATRSRRSLAYVNNFLFVPKARVADLPFLDHLKAS